MEGSWTATAARGALQILHKNWEETFLIFLSQHRRYILSVAL